jgi:hypothetical protein
MCHNSTKVTNTLDKASIIRAPHRDDSSNVSLCRFWLFGMSKHRITARQPQGLKQLDALTERWDEVTFQELQNIFLTWVGRLQWIIQNGGESFIN